MRWGESEVTPEPSESSMLRKIWRPSSRTRMVPGAGDTSRTTSRKGKSCKDAGSAAALQHLKLSSYHHRCWGQHHPAGSEVGPWFEAQHHVDISAEPLHAWRTEKGEGLRSHEREFRAMCLYRVALHRPKVMVCILYSKETSLLPVGRCRKGVPADAV